MALLVQYYIRLIFIFQTVTIPPCNGDNIDLNCTSLDISFGDNLCNPALDVVAELRLQCCDYCANKTTEPPTTTGKDW